MTITNTSASPGNMSGVYAFTLDIKPSKGKKPGAELQQIKDTASRPLSLYVHERDDGDVVAHLGGVSLKGTRHGNDLTLTTAGMALKEHEKQTRVGASERTGEAKLTLVDGKWNGTIRLLDSITASVALEKQRDISAESLHDLAGVSLLDVGDILCGAIKQIVNAILEALEIEIGDSLRPMSACGIVKNGRGFYLFGDTAPGNIFPPIFLSTIYMPYDIVACGDTSHHYSFSLELGDFAFNPETILGYLRTVNNKFLSLIGINIGSFLDALQEFLHTINEGRFAVSLVYSLYTRAADLVFSNALGITTEHLNTRSEFAWFRTLLTGIRALTGRNVDVFAGETCSDKWSACNGAIPMCNVPFFMVYLFGTANVHYD